MKAAWLWIGLVALLSTSIRAQDDMLHDSDNLRQLVSEIRKSLPAGWRAEITPDVPTDLIARNDHIFDLCCLMIWHEGKVMGRRVGLANLANGEAGPYEQVVPRFQLTVVKYLTPEGYAKAADENIKRQRARLEFEEKRAMGGAAWMGARPVPPGFRKPTTAEQKENVRQYALLWTKTQLEPLPTHYYRTLAFDALLNENLELKDTQLSAEQEKIREALLKLITAYPKKALPIDP